MDDLVVDCDVVVKWFAAEPYSAEARRVLAEHHAGGLRLLAPDLLPAEFGNVVWKKVLFQGLPTADARQILDDFRKLTVALTPTADLLDDAFRLAVTHRRSFYDMLYLALSVRETAASSRRTRSWSTP